MAVYSALIVLSLLMYYILITFWNRLSEKSLLKRFFPAFHCLRCLLQTRSVPNRAIRIVIASEAKQSRHFKGIAALLSGARNDRFMKGSGCVSPDPDILFHFHNTIIFDKIPYVADSNKGFRPVRRIPHTEAR